MTIRTWAGKSKLEFALIY